VPCPASPTCDSSAASLDEIAAGIGLVDNVQLDLTRTHTVPTGETDTRIFIRAVRPAGQIKLHELRNK